MPQAPSADPRAAVRHDDATEGFDVLRSALAPAETIPPSNVRNEQVGSTVTSLLPPAGGVDDGLRESVEAYERISEPGGLGGAAYKTPLSRPPLTPLHGFEPSPARAELLTHMPLPTSELPTIPPEAGAFLEDKGSHEALEQEIEELRVLLLARDAKLRELQASLAESNTEAARVERLKRQLAQRDARIMELEERQQVLERQVRELDAGIGKGRERERQLGANLEQATRRADALELALAEAVRKLRSSESSLAEAQRDRADLEQTLVSTRGSNAILERALQAAERARDALHSVRASEFTERGDDLQAVKGVGPAFERALNVLGVTRYEQIAAWTPEDIGEFARKLRTKPERIVRDGWVESARELAGEKVRGP